VYLSIFYHTVCRHQTLYLGPPSETYLRCLEEVQSISCATLFAPVMRCEVIQSMSMSPFSSIPSLNEDIYSVLVSGWSDNGWLSGGHAVRMAMEHCKLLCSSYQIVRLPHPLSKRCTKRGQNYIVV